ncbi:hypothetical protein ACS0TY_011250 [Phlomoides rotata]
MGIEKPLEPPKNGLLVPDLIPVAYEVLDTWKCCLSVNAQKFMLPDLGTRFKTVMDQLVEAAKVSIHGLPIDSYHMFDPFGRRIKHETRFSYDRIPAVVELCIQAGVELPGYPSRKRMEPIRMIRKKVIDMGGFVDEPRLYNPGSSGPPIVEFDTHRAHERFPPPAELEVPMIAQETLKAYEKVKWGVRKLMKKYSAKACGYCPEVHVGPWGHNAKLCGEFKHQWRDGKHGWQDATVHRITCGIVKIQSGLRWLVHSRDSMAGARVPDKYKPMMRVDIVVPEDEEARFDA